MTECTAFISIITISRDDPAGLEKTLNSIIAQDFPCYEILLVRQGSSRELDISAYKALHDIEQSGQGIAAAFNAALPHVRGNWIQFLNGGDAFLDASVLRRMVVNTGMPVDVVTGFSRRHDGSRIPRHEPDLAGMGRYYISHQATLFSARLFPAGSFFDTTLKIRMDLEWLLRSIGSARIHFMPEDLIDYDDGGISTRSPLTFSLEELRVVFRHGGHWAYLFGLVFFRLPWRLLRFLKAGPHFSGR